MAKTDWNSRPDSSFPQEVAYAVPSGHDPIVDSFGVGDLEIDWTVAAPGYFTARVTVKLHGREVGSHLFSPGSYQWVPAEIHSGGDTLALVMQFLPASPAGNGELTLVSLRLLQAGGETIQMTNVMLQGWDFVGAWT